ncbi:DUF4386 domain-containing protein [Lentzea sp. BCCO 10_0856]|uniref:DUF4386 domain-containing protein n=1 Tax=Lentzea miocenica TaxID=3095431 RepID=A0ABU4T1Q3_9PSEU|nr:DUF4386 domain-containing protein [Lentzea sp. BCCO 10_0856]MDX8032088.1 DUF4386 domain-containing protein [Lentzea sp. BCCO 10_0856]
MRSRVRGSSEHSASPGNKADRAFRHASVAAGAGLLLMSALAGFAKFVALDGLVAKGDPVQTAANITESAGLFRFGVACVFVVIALDVVVAWGLYRVFSPAGKNLSMLSAAFRLVYTAVFMVAIGQLLRGLRLLGDDDYLAVFGAEQLHALALLEVTAFNDLWMAGLGLFGLHLILVGYLAYRSGYVPRLLGVLLVVAGLGYVIDSFGVMLSQSAWTDVASYTFIGEFLLALWLVIWGSRLTISESQPHEDPVATTR